MMSVVIVLETGQVTDGNKQAGNSAVTHQTMSHCTPRRCTIWAVAQLKQSHTLRQTGFDLGMNVSSCGDLKEQRVIAVYTRLVSVLTTSCNGYCSKS
jgi:hypothetical protein